MGDCICCLFDVMMDDLIYGHIWLVYALFIVVGWKLSFRVLGSSQRLLFKFVLLVLCITVLVADQLCYNSVKI
jgi:hypothetical protein